MHVLHKYKITEVSSIFPKVHTVVSFWTLCGLRQALQSLLDMYFSLALILASLPFLTTAVPLADPLASRGIAVPIAKRGNPSNGVADTSELLTNIRRSVAYALPSFADRSGYPPIINRKIQTGFTAFEINTGVAHLLSRSIKLSRRGSGGDPLTDDEAQALLWYGTISVGTPAVSFTGMITYMIAEATI
jgi:cathepsin D